MTPREALDADGFLHVAGVVSPDRLPVLRAELDRLCEETLTSGWYGDWFDHPDYKDAAGARSVLVRHDLVHVSRAWSDFLQSPRMARLALSLLGEATLHHASMLVKPPRRGQVFPMHQDHPYYPHRDSRFVLMVIYLDDANEENGPLAFLRGSHQLGPLPHLASETSKAHLDPNVYRMADAVTVYPSAGDVVCFTPYTVHGSGPNRSDAARRTVRVGFRHPDNEAA